MQPPGMSSNTLPRNGAGPGAGGLGAAAARGRRGRPPADPGTLMRAIRYIGHYRRVAVLAYGSLFVATAAQLVVPQLIQNIIDEVIKAFVASKVLAQPAAIQVFAAQKLGLTVAQLQANQSGATAALATAMLGVAGFAILRALFAFSQSFNAERVSQSVAYDFRRDLFTKISRLSFSYHDKNQTGQLMIRATDDVEKVRLFIGQGLVVALQSVVLLVATLLVLWFTNPALTLVILPILPIAFSVFFVFGRMAQPLFMAAQIRLSALNTVLQENVAGLKVIKAFAREPEEQVRFRTAADAVLAQQLKVARIFSFLFPVIFLIANLGQAAILYFGGTQIINGKLTLGEWQKFSLYLAYVFMPMGQLGFIINLMSQASASAQRIFEILDTRNEIQDKPGALELAEISGAVEFDNVTFRYFRGGDAVLNGVSFVAEPGQTIALLGATGSGKTTIINLLPRFYDVSEGRVLVDGHDVRDVAVESLRANIGIVLQETTLFSGTIRENIAYGRPRRATPRSRPSPAPRRPTPSSASFRSATQRRSVKAAPH